MDSRFSDFCSERFRFSDLIACGETWSSLHREAPGPIDAYLPKEPESWTALSALAVAILDPLADRFGAIELTYGFACPALTRHVHGRIAPGLDQHAAHERNRKGGLVCTRGGAAVDLRLPGMDAVEVARWIARSLAFDRMYLYGNDRPLHVSFGPERTGAIWTLRPVRGNYRVPVWFDPRVA